MSIPVFQNNEGLLDTTKLSPNKRALLEKYLQGKVGQEGKAASTIEKRTEGTVTPLSFGQQQMWVLAQLIPDVPVYNESVTVRLPGPLDATALERSLNEVIRRHEVWRTTFPVVNEQPVQVVHSSLTLELPVIDLRHLPVSEREPHAIHLATEQATPLFDLTKLPLLRATLIRLADEDHRLYLTLHHILFDGVIYEVFLPELYAHYQAFVSGQPSPLPPLPVQYGDFAIWQRKRLQTQKFAEQMAYWKRQLASAPISLELPIDRPYPAVQSHHGARRPFSLPASLVDALKLFSRQENATLYQTLVASFNTLLYRYTGQTDILLGTTAIGHAPEETRELLGVFLNTLVLRTDLSGNPTFRELLRRVRAVVLEAHANRDIPFETLVSELRPERNLQKNPFIQVIMSLEPSLPVLSSGWTITQSDVEAKTAKFDLYLELDDRPDGFAAWLEYNTDIFEESTAQRMIGHWQTLLQGIVADPSMHIADLPLLTSAERQMLLVQWNDTAIQYPQDRCLHQLFEAQAKRTPDAIAVIFEGQQLTYQELNRRANQLAHHLQKLGAGPEVLIGICVERSLEMIVGLLGILMTGGAYVPLDPSFPRDRLTFMQQDAKIPLLLTQQHLLEHIPVCASRVVCLDTDWERIAIESSDPVISEVTATNIAYILYTSGSTGVPKGVVVQHRSVVNILHFMSKKLEITANDTWLAVTTLSFDIATLELFLPLVTAARLVIASSQVVVDGSQLAQLVNSATVMQATPATWHVLIGTGWQGHQRLKMVCGGEALPRKLASQLLSRGAMLWNVYGPTETTIWSTIERVERSDDPVSIGRPLANTQLYVLDRLLQPTPIGVTGELYIGGDGLARGYYQRERLTAERFIRSPFSTDAEARLYKTGDLARFLPDGRLEFIGRIDHQIKLRGFRIELGEIEAVLSQHPAVCQAVVVTREYGPGDKRLVAYLVLHKDQTAVIEDLKSHIMKQVPAYMVPSAFVLLETLPLTPNGKIDRRALPTPEPSRNTAMDTFVAPTLLLHHQLVQIWEDLLSTRPIGIKDNFFDLGGHSLLAIHMIDRVAHACGKKLPLSTLFGGATIEHLTTALMESAKTDSRTPLVAVQADGSRQPFFYLHGEWNGGAFYTLELARYLGPDQPFYLLEPYKFDGLLVPPTFEAIAAAHLKSLRAVQPEGPYLLGGYCNGGLVAYEMARQLHEEGQTVDMLVLMEPDSPARRRWIRRVISRFCDLMHIGQDKQLNWFLCLQHVYRYLRFPHYRQLKNSVLLENIEQEKPGYKRSKIGIIPLILRLKALVPKVEVLRQEYLNVYDWIVSDYTPGLYPGKITFFWTSEEPWRSIGWRKVIKAKEGEVEIHIIPGNHITSRTKYLHVLAERLHTCLSKAQTTAMS